MSHPSPQLGTIMPYIDTIYKFVNLLMVSMKKSVLWMMHALPSSYMKEHCLTSCPLVVILRQKILRSTYQTGHVWGNLLDKGPTLPNMAMGMAEIQHCINPGACLDYKACHFQNSTEGARCMWLQIRNLQASLCMLPTQTTLHITLWLQKPLLTHKASYWRVIASTVYS